MPGRPPKFYSPGSPSPKFQCVSRLAYEKELIDGRLQEFMSYEVGLQISCGVYPKVSSENAVRKSAPDFDDVLRALAERKECRVEEGHLMPDHVHMLLAIASKYGVSQVVGYIKGKSAIHIARVYGERKRNFVGQHFWARSFFVSTLGRDEEVIREYIRRQEEEDRRLEQLDLLR